MSDEIYAVLVTVFIMVFLLVLACWKPYLYERKIKKAIKKKTCSKCGHSLRDSEVQYESVGKNRISYYWISKCHSCREKNSFKNHLPLESFESAPN